MTFRRALRQIATVSTSFGPMWIQISGGRTAVWAFDTSPSSHIALAAQPPLISYLFRINMNICMSSYKTNDSSIWKDFCLFSVLYSIRRILFLKCSTITSRQSPLLTLVIRGKMSLLTCGIISVMYVIGCTSINLLEESTY